MPFKNIKPELYQKLLKLLGEEALEEEFCSEFLDHSAMLEYTLKWELDGIQILYKTRTGKFNCPQRNAARVIKLWVKFIKAKNKIIRRE